MDRRSLAFVVLCLIWGSTWFVIKDGLDYLPPFLGAGIRFLMAGAIIIENVFFLPGLGRLVFQAIGSCFLVWERPGGKFALRWKAAFASSILRVNPR